MTLSHFESLRKAVLGASDGRKWSDAVDEWEIVGLEEDPSAQGTCVCGKQNLSKLFTIKNTTTGHQLFPIGSSCINHFGRDDLDHEVTVLSDLAKMRGLIRARQQIPFTSEYFSRALLEYFYDAGVFTPDHWNSNDGWNDYDFLLTMFNKQRKDGISEAQQRKIWALVHRKVVPFVQRDPRIN